MILIDGRECPDSLVDPAKHRYQGMFRFPFGINGPVSAQCPKCGKLMFHYSANTLYYDCWIAGHFDVPQYQTIGEGKT